MIRNRFRVTAIRTLVAASLASSLLTGIIRAQGELIISEIHYNPSDQAGDLSDFLEIKNVGDAAVNVSGFQWDVGLGNTTVTQNIIQPGGFLVLAQNSAQFFAKYGFSPGGTFTGGLSGSGERIDIVDGAMNELFSVRYWDGDDPDGAEEEGRDDWPQSPDGDGHTLVLFDSSRAPEDPDDFRNWRPSINLFGSPGADEPLPNPLEVVFVNEIRSRDGSLANDAVELYNPGLGMVDVSGWFLTDTLNNPKKTELPNGSVIPGGGYLVFENGVNGIQLSISSKGERAFLYSGDGEDPTGYVHGYFVGPSGDGTTFSRHMNADGNDQLKPALPSLNGPNNPPRFGPVVITEIMYDPGVPGGNDEFIEIRNISDQTVPLYDTANPNNSWRVEGVSYTLPSTQPSLAPGEIALITPTHPADFRAAHGIDPSVQIFGPYGIGMDAPSLRNGGEMVALQRPEIIDPNTPDEELVHIDVDAVEYDNRAPWPESAAAQQGKSLVRIDPEAYGDESVNWRASFEPGGTPGTILEFTGLPVVVNEILAHTDLPLVDLIELYNPNNVEVNIGDWWLSDDNDTPRKVRIPSDTIIPAMGYWAINGDNDDNPFNGAPAGYFGSGASGFNLSENGERVILSSGDASGELTGYQDNVRFPGTDNGVSIGRYVNGQGQVSYPPMLSRTFGENAAIPNPGGAENSAPKNGPVVISEMLYDPLGAAPEFIEVTNVFGGAFNADWFFGAGVTLPASVNITIAAGGRAIFLPQGTDANAFRAANSVPGPVPVIGGVQGYTGALNNGGEEVVFAYLGPPNADEGGARPVITVDIVEYDDSKPWPVVGADTGRSIERIDVNAYGSEATNWKTSNAIGGSPGTANSTGTIYEVWALNTFTEQELDTPGLTGPGDDINGDGYANLLAYGYGFDPRTAPLSGVLPKPVVLNDPGTYIGIEIRRRIGAGDLVYRVQDSTDLASWSENTVQVGLPLDNGDGTESVMFRNDVEMAVQDEGFLRGIVELP